MTTINPCKKCGVMPLPYVAYGVSDWVLHKCQWTTWSCYLRTWNDNHPLPAPKAQGETMDKGQPWIDGAKEKPPMGARVWYRNKEDDLRGDVFSSRSVDHEFWDDRYWTLATPPPFVPPVEPLPELEPTRDYGATRETETLGNWWIELIKLDGVALTVRHADRATARRMFNAAAHAMKGAT